VIFLPVREGQAAACLATRYSTASRESGLPRWEAKTTSLGCPASSASQVQHGDGGAGQRGDPVFAAFAVAAHVRGGTQVQVLDAQVGQLADAQSGLDGQGEQGVVAPAEPCALVGGGQQRGGLVRGQVVDDGPVAAFGRDGQHARDHCGVLGGLQGGVAKQGPDRGQPGVAGGHAVAPRGLQMRQERHDQGGVQIGDVQVDGLLAGRVRGIGH
jgi:hypothetical protein